MPRNIIHSDVSVDPESESEALSIVPDVEEEPEIEPEEEEEEGEGEGEGEEEDEDGDEREEGDDGEEVEDEGEEADEPEEEEEEEEPADDGDGDAVQETTPSRSSRLKITLKLPTQTQKPPRVRRTVHKDKDLDSDIESEDDDDDEQPRRGDGKRPLTTRQAVLASVVGASHVSLDETSRKKKQLNEAEIALRREETARKRKHLSEKKLEDEKAETINRLLKKKSGTRNRRNPLASAEDRTPATHTGNGTPAEGEVDEEESGEAVVVPVVEVVPTRYRWISTLRPCPDAPAGDKMFLSFSVPTSLLPQPELDADGDTKMEAEDELREPRSAAPAVCDVEGCTVRRKYRLVRDRERGACGMDHLHLLERQPGTVITA
ncbi:hypothetical protein BJV74DRAFT_879232 [Russula compacta]|nr:hypothetical protein BJV74DRAFT_879232 [Russula compacta]